MKWRSAALAAFVLAAGFASSARAETPAQEKSIGAFRVRIVVTRDEGNAGADAYRLEIRRADQLLLERKAGPFEKLRFPDWAPPGGADVTGRGQPDIVVEYLTGGAHCCTTALIYELGPTPSLISQIEARDDDGITFEERPGLGWVARFNDWTFASWNAPFVRSPAVPVTVAYRVGAFHLVPELMRTPPWSDELIDRATQIVRSDFDFEAGRKHDLPSSLWAVMLSLIYSGHRAQAQEFFERAWPMAAGEVWKYELGRRSYAASPEGRRQFWNDFLAQLATSPYWADLQAMNELPPLPGKVERMPDMPAFWLGLKH